MEMRCLRKGQTRPCEKWHNKGSPLRSSKERHSGATSAGHGRRLESQLADRSKTKGQRSICRIRLSYNDYMEREGYQRGSSLVDISRIAQDRDWAEATLRLIMKNKKKISHVIDVFWSCYG